ncbi:MAG: tetratricopeptide repeat protein [Spirochaetales bacterium]|nr:MAG: tetratricopeptide repeat protein [Spirochaetales bacterium]
MADMKKLLPAALFFLLISFTLSAQNAGELFGQGNTAYKAGDYTAAYDLFTRAVAAEPENARYQYNLGLAARKLNLYSESAGALNKAKKLDPSVSFTGNPQDFEDKLTEMTRLSDSAADEGGSAGIFAEGEAAYKNGDYERAFDFFSRAVTGNPGVAKYQYNLGLAARKIKNYPAALAAFEEAKRLDPVIGFTSDKQGFEDKLAEVRSGAAPGSTSEAAGEDASAETAPAQEKSAGKPARMSSKNLRTFLMLLGAAIFITIIRLTSKRRKGGSAGKGSSGQGGRYSGGTRSGTGDYHDYDRYSSSGTHSSSSSSIDHS